jgi:hypothetical protein
MWKKLLAITLSVIITAGLAACSDNAVSMDPDAVRTGTTISTKLKAEKDKKYHKVTYKVTAIVRDQKKVRKYIKHFNEAGTASTIPSLKSDELEYCVIKYSVKFPENYPRSEFGITNVTLPFRIEGENGDPIKVGRKVYKGLTKTYEIGDVPVGYDFDAGDTYHGRALFLMVKDYKTYEITESYKSGGKKVTHYIQGI